MPVDDVTNTTNNDDAPEQTPAPNLRVVEYALLLKPRVMSLVVFTAWTGMMMAPGSIDFPTGVIAIICIAVAAGASGAINMWYDRDIDIIMKRTQHRPLPAGRLEPLEALGFGVFLSVASVSIMAIFVNIAAAGWLMTTIVYYVFIYTIWLKRRTPQNIVIGGAAGAFPPMIGWIAVTGGVEPNAWILFLIIFLWTPPHTWALALFRSGDYEAAGVPMMPVVVGHHKTAVQMLLYTLVLIPVTLLPTLLGISGRAYMTAAIVLGIGLLRHAIIVLKDDDAKKARSMFLFSILYLFMIFVFLLVDKGLMMWLPEYFS
ncbi:MAG: protoheme IX farnesyltransferase [Rhodospirillaceae bacterium]|nr:protoheme IX farnesyltransferase [Rhodospirillaceae bacterium]MBL6940576.1 protoheme IX farnesyltransferase [Rhodospirillales bacterium]